MGYDEEYQNIDNVFGSEPEKILLEHFSKIDISRSVLDIGAGQGRNSFFLANHGYSIDAIDPSSVAAAHLKDEAQKNQWNLRSYQKTFNEFKQDSARYSAILVFGLIQILNWQEIEELLRKIEMWSEKGSKVFITAFTILDPSFTRYKTTWKQIGHNSFSDKLGNVRTFLDLGELKEIFRKFQVLHYLEGNGPEHHHGDGELEYHHICEAVFIK